jgi:hypothetical protein
LTAALPTVLADAFDQEGHAQAGGQSQRQGRAARPNLAAEQLPGLGGLDQVVNLDVCRRGCVVCVLPVTQLGAGTL